MDETPLYPPQDESLPNAIGPAEGVPKKHSRGRRWLKLTFGVGIAAAILVGGYFLLGYVLFHQFFDGRRVHDVDLAQWDKLQMGMTKTEVINLIGPPPSHLPPATVTAWGKTFRTTETWQYRWADPMAVMVGSGASPKAYALWFDESGALAKFRAPVEMDLSRATDGKEFILEEPASAAAFAAHLTELGYPAEEEKAP